MWVKACLLCESSSGRTYQVLADDQHTFVCIQPIRFEKVAYLAWYVFHNSHLFKVTRHNLMSGLANADRVVFIYKTEKRVLT